MADYLLAMGSNEKQIIFKMQACVIRRLSRHVRVVNSNSITNTVFEHYTFEDM